MHKCTYVICVKNLLCQKRTLSVKFIPVPSDEIRPAPGMTCTMLCKGMDLPCDHGL